MEILKESILSHSSHGGEGFKAQRREMIEKWLKEYNIRNYTINDDFTIDVNQNVDISLRNLIEFPEYIQFEKVNGYFKCNLNELISLRGCPRVVRGDFNCAYNNLTTLEGGPKEVGGKFLCDSNYLTSLKGTPEKVRGDFYCRGNNTEFTEEDIRVACRVKGEINV